MRRTRYSILFFIVLCLWVITSLYYFQNKDVNSKHLAEHTTYVQQSISIKVVQSVSTTHFLNTPKNAQEPVKTKQKTDMTKTEPPTENTKPTLKPKTTATKPKPTTAEPKPTTAEPKPTTVEPKPTTAEPKPTNAEPKPTTTEPKPTTAEPKPTTAEPKITTAEPKPTTAEPKPTTAEPKPTTAEPKPTTEKPKPTTAELKLTTTKQPKTTKPSPVERWKREIGNQKCKIPTFDALHPQIMPYVSLDIGNPAPLNRKAKIENGMLKLKLKNAARASFRYIHRHKDYKYKYSEPINLMEQNGGKAGCIQSADKSCVLQAVEDSRNASKSASTKYTLRCKKSSCNPSDEENDDAFFFHVEGTIIHKKTGKCLQSLGCIEESTAYDDGQTFLVYTGVGSAQTCQKHCKSHEKCNAWVYIKEKENCRLQVKAGKRIHDKKGYQVGPKICKNVTFPQIHLVNKEECDTIWSLFRYNSTTERIQHLPTLKCVGVESYSKVVLLDCGSQATQLDLPSNFLPKSDLDVSFPLSEEFVRLEYRQRTIGGGDVTEHHSHVIEKNLKYNVTKRQNDEELNIVMIMFDSQSNKNIQRQFRKTFHYLQTSPNTIMLNNHVITGDGTTANLGPMLAGKHVFDLPEARPWYTGSQYLDRWPLIFKDFQKKGYVTLYGDDDPFLGALHYRLSGFKDLPTDKYLLPYFYSTDCGYQTCHQYAYDYLQRYIDTYSSYKHFSFMSLGKLGHDYIDRPRYGDRDTFNFLKSLFENKRHRNNTAIFVFGDHGHRTSKLRESIWGKLEERLPFMSLTFPPWFFEKYKEKISMLRLNSHVLTSHFDIYYTLLHLLNPDTYKAPSIEKRKGRRVTFGKSLFTNIAKLNRTCEEAGVPLHFCPCTEYKPANTNDQLVKRIFNTTVSFINEMVRNSTLTKDMCVELQLKKIIRARSVAPSEKMQKHEETFENAKCDRCGLKEDKNFSMKVTQYELVFSVEPSQGIFEATVEYLHDTKTIRVNPDISRVNRYGDQPKCIANRFPHLRKYCYCKDFIQKQR